MAFNVYDTAGSFDSEHTYPEDAEERAAIIGGTWAGPEVGSEVESPYWAD